MNKKKIPDRHTLLLLALLWPLAATAQNTAPAPGAATEPAAPTAEAPAPASWSLEHLMQQRAQVLGERTTFAETRRIPSADTVIKSSGVLLYRAPDRLERQTSGSDAERTLIEGERIVLEMGASPGETTRREFALSDLPGLRPFFNTLRAVLGGDLEALRRHFNITLDGDEPAWRMKLVPRERADQHVRDIVLSGNSRDILSIELRQKNGDSTHTALKLENVELKPPSAPATANGS